MTGLSRGRTGKPVVNRPCFRKYAFRPEQTPTFRIVDVTPSDFMYDPCICQKIEFNPSGYAVSLVYGSSRDTVTQSPYQVEGGKWLTLPQISINSDVCPGGPCCDRDPTAYTREDFIPFAKPETVNLDALRGKATGELLLSLDCLAIERDENGNCPVVPENIPSPNFATGTETDDYWTWADPYNAPKDPGVTVDQDEGWS